MNKINLHTHTNHSLDGAFNINEVINKCLESGLSFISITDHDTCDAYLELDLDKINAFGTLVYGIEADAVINNITYDILCYGFNLEKVFSWAKEQYGTIESRQLKIYNRLLEICKELDLFLDDREAYDPTKEFAHGAIFRMLNNGRNKEFLEKYNITSTGELYRLSTMDMSFPLYIDMRIVWPDIVDLSKIIHENGGKLFLAHPKKYSKEKNVEEILDSCCPYIDGIEIANEPENEEEVKYLYSYAKRNDLLISVGSDFHGTIKHNKVEVDYIDEEMTKEIEKWIDEVPGKISF